MPCPNCQHPTIAVAHDQNAECLECGHKWNVRDDPATRTQLAVDEVIQELEWIVEGCLDLEDARFSAQSALNLMRTWQAEVC